MWWGPYDSATVKSGMSACWRYSSNTSPLNTGNNSAYIDLRATDTHNVVHTYFQTTLVLTNNNHATATNGYSTTLYCTPVVAVPAGNYHNIEIRMKPVSIKYNSSASGYINLLGTNYTVY